MGNVESRFGTLLVQGKEEEAMEQWKENFELQTRFQPNTQIKASQYRDTPLHCTVRFEMKELMVEFLSMGGDPFSTNALGETPLHIVCRAAKISSRRSRKRAELLRLLLDRIPSEETFEVVRSMEAKKSDWKSASVVSSGADRDTHHLGMQDKVWCMCVHVHVHVHVCMYIHMGIIHLHGQCDGCQCFFLENSPRGGKMKIFGFMGGLSELGV